MVQTFVERKKKFINEFVNLLRCLFQVNMIDIQERLQAPIDSIRLGSTGGAYVTPMLMKKIRKVMNVETISVSQINK